MARRLEVRGLLRSAEYARAVYLSRQLPDTWDVTVEGMLEADWQTYCQQCRQRGDHLAASAVVTIDAGTQDFESLQWLSSVVAESTGRFDTTSEDEARQRADALYLEHLCRSECRYVKWEVAVGEDPPRSVVLELAEVLCPKTVAAFWQLACGSSFLSYRGSVFHRIVPGGFIEGGLLKTSSGQQANCTHSGETLLDENYAYRHDRAGVLGFSRSVPNRNGSAFYITLRPMPSLDTKNVAFGRVVEGMDVISHISQVPTKNQRPLSLCKIVRSGPLLDGDGKVLRENSSPRIKIEHTRTQSKLEVADIDTLRQRRDAIVKDIEKTAEELSEEEAMLALVSEIIHARY